MATIVWAKSEMPAAATTTRKVKNADETVVGVGFAHARLEIVQNKHIKYI